MQDIARFLPHWCCGSGNPVKEVQPPESGNVLLDALQSFAGESLSFMPLCILTLCFLQVLRQPGPKMVEKMTLLHWTVAFQRYAIAAACAPVDGAKGHCIWDYESSMAHMDIVLQVLCMLVSHFPRACSRFLYRLRLEQGIKRRRSGWV